MYERTNAAIEDFWADRAQRLTAGNGRQQQNSDEILPFENGSIENKNTCCNIILGQDYSFCAPKCEGITRDLEEKEHARTRGIPGYTGTQPPPDKVQPWKPSEDDDPSKTYAINAFDGRKPRVKGIPGYTGHQPVPGRKDSNKQASPNRGQDQHTVRFIADGQEMISSLKGAPQEETGSLQTEKHEESVGELSKSAHCSQEVPMAGMSQSQNQDQTEQAQNMNGTMQKPAKDITYEPGRVPSSKFPIRMHVGF